MEKKHNSTKKQKHSNNKVIYNLKSTSQRISVVIKSQEQTLKINNNKNARRNGNILPKNHLINLNHKNKSLNIKQNSKYDDFSLDNISNIIESKKNKCPKAKIILEDNISSLVYNKTNIIKRLSTITETNEKAKTFPESNPKIWDSYIKSFQLKMKKMKEMNKTIIKETYINKDKNKKGSSKKNNSKSITNSKQKIKGIKNKNKVLGNMKEINSFNKHLNEIHNNKFNKNNEQKCIKKDCFLCCKY